MAAKKDGEETPGSAPHSPLKAKASAHVRDATDPWGADAMAVGGGYTLMDDAVEVDENFTYWAEWGWGVTLENPLLLGHDMPCGGL